MYTCSAFESNEALRREYPEMVDPLSKRLIVQLHTSDRSCRAQFESHASLELGWSLRRRLNFMLMYACSSLLIAIIDIVNNNIGLRTTF